MKSSYDIKKEIENKQKLLEKVDYLESVIREISPSYCKDILKDLEHKDGYLIFMLPIANKEWSNDILKIVIKITEDGNGYVYANETNKGNNIIITDFFL